MPSAIEASRAPGDRPDSPRTTRRLALAAKALDLVRDAAIAAIFRRDETDTLFVAFTLPSAARVLLVDGMTTRALAPMVSRALRKEGEGAARQVFAKLQGLAGAALVLLTAAGMVFAEPLTALLAAGYRRRFGEFERTVWLTRLLFPYLLLAGLAAVGSVALHAARRRTLARLTPLLQSAAVLGAIAFLPRVLDARGLDRTLAIAAGVLAGALAPAVLDGVLRRRAGWSAPAVIDPKAPELRDALRRMTPVVVALAPFYLELFASRRLLSEMPPGAQSAFWWAMRLCELPIAVVAGAVALAPLEAHARADEGEHDATARLTTQRLRLALFAGLPAAAVTVVLASAVVRAILQRGAFDAAAAAETARSMTWQGGAIGVGAVLAEVSSGFYAVGRVRTPAWLGLGGAFVFLGFALGLRGRMGSEGISAALALSSAAQLTVALPLLSRALPGLDFRSMAWTTLRSGLSAALAALVAAALAWTVHEATGDGPLARLLPGLLGTVAFVALYVGTARALRSKELEFVARALERRREEEGGLAQKRVG